MGYLMPSGLLEGVFASFGEFDECLDIESPSENGSPIYGQYCLMSPVIPYPKLNNYQQRDEEINFGDSFKLWSDFLVENKINKYLEINPMLKFIEAMNLYNGSVFRIGICIPDKCDPGDVGQAVNKCKNNFFVTLDFLFLNFSNFYFKSFIPNTWDID
jgi:hypothetical protein